MRTRIVLVSVATAGIAAAGLSTFAGPALAATGADSAAAAVTSRVDRVKQALAGLVTDGTLTQDQADEVATTLGSADLGPGPGGPGRHGGPGGPGRDLSAAATALGLAEADLRTALDSGKTLAQVAQDKGVSVDTLVAALVKAEQERLARAVTDGRLTQAQADARSADLEARTRDRITRVRPPHGDHPRGLGPDAPDAPPPADQDVPDAPTPAPTS